MGQAIQVRMPEGFCREREGKQLMKTVDLHAHTTASDGSYTPAELVRYAKEKGARLGIRVIPGIELSTRVGGCDVHMVALFINCKNKALIRKLEEMAARRRERNLNMVDKLQAAGFRIGRADLESLGTGKIIARGHIAQILIDRGYASNLKEALLKYLSKGGPGYAPKEAPAPEECIRLAHEAGGLVFVAHLHQIDPASRENCVRICRQLLKAGADGAAESLAQEYGCLRSGGSDFHGRLKKGLDLGSGYGDLAVPYEFVEAMEEKLSGCAAPAAGIRTTPHS